MLQQTDIKRVKLAPVMEPMGECLDVAGIQREAEELLGYATPKGAESATASDSLLDALRRLEIEILDWRDVVRYKMERQHEAEMRELAQTVEGERYPYRWQSLPSAVWQEVPLEKHGEAIPAHVLLKALQIKREVPEALFYVERFSVGRDPFLFVTLNPDHWSNEPYYYIEVWEEPGFEGR